MALQKTIVTKGVTVTDAYHTVEAVRVTSDGANVNVRIFSSAGESANSASLLDQKNFQVTGADFTEYFGTPHATKNVLQRGQDYLKEKVEFYSDASVI